MCLWFGHLERLSSEGIKSTRPRERNDTAVECWGFEEKGKPTEQWIDGVRKRFISKGLADEDAEDRELWESKISLE